ncbi:TIGR00153 family protein [Methanohalophilus sp.]|uniref:TIGR00153 family protein n=1 Tax=Methanohalophilus sp. TaxID=1966352 RepID=UPI002611B4A3|nr:TIGR00153 family protein [Methanohalophilus sp.]MDK2891671.1 uncharacterized protein [Methanohalophilus sp.]
MKKFDYIRTVLDIFATSPFKPIAMHASKGVEATYILQKSFEAYCEGNMDAVLEYSRQIDSIEHEADIIKQTIRSEISSSIMLPVKAEDLFNFLKPQDSIADVAQEVGFWMTLRKCEVPQDLKEELKRLVEKTIETVDTYELLIGELEDLLESSFGKKDVKEALALVPRVEELEHEVDIIEKNLMMKIFNSENELGGAAVYHLTELVKLTGDIADKAEHAADRLRTMILRR